MRSHWITHNGKRIFVCDCSFMQNDELAAELDTSDVEIMKQPKKSVLTVTDVRGLIG